MREKLEQMLRVINGLLAKDFMAHQSIELKELRQMIQTAISELGSKEG